MENLMHKSDLNSYCQRINIPLPVYNTTFNGCCNALRFACTVSVGGKSFTSPTTFTNRKSAEQDAAKLALQHLLSEDEARTANLRVYLRKLVSQDKARCKMILKEFLDKIKMECAYETVQVEMTHGFVSSLVLNGTCYKGEGGKSKKEAEQLAALAAILSLLDDPTYATPISEVIKSKFSACAVFNELKEFPNTRGCSVTSNEFKANTSDNDVLPLTQAALLIGENSLRDVVDEKKPTLVDLDADSIEEQGGSGSLVSENKQVLVNSLPQIENQVNKTSLPQTEKQGGSGVLVSENKQVLVNSLPQIEDQVNKTSLPQTEKQGVQGLLDDTQCVAGHLPGTVTISRCSYVALPRTSAVTISRCPYVNMPRPSPLVSEPQHEIKLPEATQLASQQIGVPTELLLVLAAAHDSGNHSISSKKRRRKNKKKANKRLPRTPPIISEPQPVIKLQEATKPASQQIDVPTEFVLVPAAAHNPCNNSISSKKRRRKNKKKANKRLRAENK